MKKVLPILTLVLVVVLLTAGLIACNDETNGGATYLNPPLVTLNGNVASWEANSNATKFEISMGGSLIKVENTVTSRTLAEGVAFKVRAVGDGVNYLTSDWSNTVTYTAQAVQGSKDVNFVMINDTHGAFTDSAEGYSIGRVDSLITSLESQKGDQIFIHNGDAFQGSYVCGETYGLALVEALNEMSVDCFVLGNHEFDWGIDKIAAYADGNQANGEANFPFLGANIYYKGTTTRPDWIDAYTIVEQDGVKVGIIGIMGDSQESSILTRYVKDYDFVSPMSIISSTASTLRTTLGCDVVVVAAHEYDEGLNESIASLSGNSRIDAIFGAHTHQNREEFYQRSDYKEIPAVQCYHKNNNLAEVILSLDASNEYISAEINKHRPSNYDISSNVQTIIDKYQYVINEGEEVLSTAPYGYSNSELGGFATDIMLNYEYEGYDFAEVDVSVINTGGVRAEINAGEITKAEVFEVFPFNNAVVLVNISGELIKSLINQNSGYLYFAGNYNSLSDSTIYQLAVIDYVFENTRYDQFDNLSASDYIETDVLLRDLLIEYFDEDDEPVTPPDDGGDEPVTPPADTTRTISIQEFNSTFTTLKSTQEVVKVSGVVYSYDKYGVYIHDNGVNLYVYTYFTDFSLGQRIEAKGIANSYYTQPQLQASEVTALQSGGSLIIPTTLTPISQIISENASQAGMVYDHKVYRTSGVLTAEVSGNYTNYFLVDGTDRIQIKSSTSAGDYDFITSTYLDERIAFNVVVADVYTSTGDVRVTTLSSSLNLEEVGDTPIIPDPTPVTLATPVVSVSESGLASWSAVSNASSYKYKVNSGAEQTTTSLSVQLQDGDSIVVKAVGDGESYVDSNYSTSQTYTAPTEEPPVEEGAEAVTILEFILRFDEFKNKEATVTGKAYTCDNNGIYIEDGTGTLFIYTEYSNLYVGQIVTATGKAGTSYSMPRLVITEAEDLVYGEIESSVQAPSTVTPIATILEENEEQSSMVYDHTIYRTSGIVKQVNGYYCLVDGTSKLQIAGSVFNDDMNAILAYLDKKIAINVVISDYFTTTSAFRVIPLRGNMDIVELELDDGEQEDPNYEPNRIETNIADLVTTPPSGYQTVIYVVEGIWTVNSDSSGSTYGNGYLRDELSNQIQVYGLCSSDSVVSWNGSSYTFSNNRSYSSIGLQSGDKIRVGMVYDSNYKNYKCFFISKVGVEEEDTPKNVVNFIEINDTHGAFADSDQGYSIGRVDTLVTTLETQNSSDYIFIHVGDAFQGSYVSGETYGYALVEALNEMSLDCFVVGNHEFDWGIDEIAKYKDGNTANGEANFPFLGANIFYAGTTTRPDWIDAYTIVERGDVKVGIIGIMGYGQEDSILTRYADPYDFASPLPIVSSLATELRTTKDCDVVVLATHDYTYDFNVEVGQLSGNSRIDGIFTAHTHQDINEYVTRADGKQIAVVQSLHKNNQASTIKMTLDESGDYISGTYSEYSPAGYQISSRVQTVINKYQYLINEGEEVVGNTPSSLQKATLGSYSVTAMIDYAYTNNTLGDVDVSVINTGGVRATINDGDITRAEIFEVFPFNNMVIIVNMTGATIKKMYEDNSGFVYLGVKSGLSAYTALNDSTIYQVAVIDYVYENKYYVKYFEGCQNVETGVLMRDIFLEFVEDNL